MITAGETSQRIEAVRGLTPCTAFFVGSPLYFTHPGSHLVNGNYAMLVEMRSITSIRPYENNPRLNDAAIDAVAASIKEFGFRQPIVTDEDGVIIVGHTRYFAALKLEMTTVPVHVAVGLTPAQARAYRLADNQTATLSSWDEDKLPLELMGLQEMGFDLAMTGFSGDELLRLLSSETNEGQGDSDAIPDPPDEAITQPGDLWILGKHRLLCGDSSLPDDVDRLLDGAQIHLVNTDPPYNVCVEPRSNNAIAAGLSSFQAAPQPIIVDCSEPKATKKLRARDRPLENDFVSNPEFDRLLSAWFGNLARVLLPGRAFYIWGGYSNIGNYPPVLKANGLYFSQAIVWDKQWPVLTRKDFMGAYEWAFYGWREGAAHEFFGPNNATDLWSIKKVTLATKGPNARFVKTQRGQFNTRTGRGCTSLGEAWWRCWPNIRTPRMTRSSGSLSSRWRTPCTSGTSSSPAGRRASATSTPATT
jgi:ParB-like chromosome segregation protein Spo0J